MYPSTRTLCFTYQSTNYHLPHLQTPLSMHANISQTVISGEHVHSYLLSAAIPWERSVPLWYPSCLRLYAYCWCSPPSSGGGSPKSLSAVSVIARHISGSGVRWILLPFGESQSLVFSSKSQHESKCFFPPQTIPFKITITFNKQLTDSIQIKRWDLLSEFWWDLLQESVLDC